MDCPHCNAADLPELIVLDRSGFPPGHEQHQIAYDHDVVYMCAACGHATLEQWRHDCFDYEEVYDQYEWFVLEPEDAERLRQTVAKCTGPLVSNCICAAHKALRVSARALPRRSWETGFEHGWHFQRVTFTSQKKPQFHPAGVFRRETLPTVEPAREISLRPFAIAFAISYPLILWLYFRSVDWPMAADAAVVAAAVAVAFVLAVAVASFAAFMQRSAQSVD